MGEAVPHVIGRHSHPGLAPAAPAPAAPTTCAWSPGRTTSSRPADQLRRPRRRPARPGRKRRGPRPAWAVPVTRRPVAPAPPAELAALLTDGADGALADMAAIQLLTAHHYWLTRTDFTTAFIRAGRSPLSGQALAHVRWKAAARALAAGQLPCTRSEAAILQIAAGLAASLPVPPPRRGHRAGPRQPDRRRRRDPRPPAATTSPEHPGCRPAPATAGTGRPAPRRNCHDRRSSRPTTGSPACRSAGTWPPGSCTATRPRRGRRPDHLVHHRHALGVITGEAGAGKTVALRAAWPTLDASRHTLIYLPQPPDRRPRHPRRPGHSRCGGPPPTTPRSSPRSTACSPLEHDERGRTPVLAIDEAHLLDRRSSRRSGCSRTITSIPDPR